MPTPPHSLHELFACACVCVCVCIQYPPLRWYLGVLAVSAIKRVIIVCVCFTLADGGGRTVQSLRTVCTACAMSPHARQRLRLARFEGLEFAYTLHPTHYTLDRRKRSCSQTACLLHSLQTLRVLSCSHFLARRGPFPACTTVCCVSPAASISKV
jgi:hypothetical protein